jgi:uncharacterized protein (DUF924 family)
VRARFGATIAAALAGALPAAWAAQPLAEILLLDQFTRNVFRGTPRAVAGDERALQRARMLVASGAHRGLQPLERCFAYLPFEHAEDLGPQDEGVALFEAIAGLDPYCAHALDYARRHREVIRRFGRFPHRNAILGRAGTPEEEAFLREPGSSF